MGCRRYLISHSAVSPLIVAFPLPFLILFLFLLVPLQHFLLFPRDSTILAAEPSCAPWWGCWSQLEPLVWHRAATALPQRSPLLPLPALRQTVNLTLLHSAVHRSVTITLPSFVWLYFNSINSAIHFIQSYNNCFPWTALLKLSPHSAKCRYSRRVGKYMLNIYIDE